MSDSETLVARASRRLRRDGWLMQKAMRQRLARLSDPGMAKQVVFVSGLPRSGTNMLMEAYERSAETEVFHESDPRAFEVFHMRARPVIRALVERSPARVVVIKALLEGDEVASLMDEFAPARAVWMFRHFDDVINSNMANWEGGRNQIENIVRDRTSADWRGRGMTDETHEMVKRHYRPGMNDASALGLFYCYRHQLFYDQGFDTDPRVCLMNYEELVSTPGPTISEVATFSDLKPAPRMYGRIHARSIKRSASPDIDDDIRALTDAMYERLRQTRQQKSGQRQAA